jgi:NDP-sugar pyrophosphorylase family protein
MQAPLRLGILGAGLGSRLQSVAQAKPLAALGGISLLERLIAAFRAEGTSEIHCALRAELIPAKARETLPAEAHYHFMNTESSLHTLAALVAGMRPARDETILFSMADTVLRTADLRAFVAFCADLAPGECAVLCTTYVDDEKPLWVEIDDRGYAKKFGGDRSGLVTSGMYVLSSGAMAIAKENVAAGQAKMRNFLADLAARHVPIKTFVVSQTIDVDHPSDLEKAEAFLRSD